jgi:methylmalonyl-CoA mutase N-terminal domain/subunit
VLARGIDIDAFAPQLSFHFTMCRDLFEEVAKVRACRRLWAKIVRDRFRARDSRSLRMRFFNGGSGATLAAEEPLNNIVRGTIQCLAGVLSGAQACHVPAYDEAYDIPSEESATIALRTQQIIAHESGVTRTVDPLGGSYYIEYLTDQMEQRISAVVKEIEDGGGMEAAIERGDLQRAIADHAFSIEQQKASGQRIVVASNAFCSDGASGRLRSRKRDAEAASRQIARLQHAKSKRDQAAVDDSLAALRSSAQGTESVMPALITAARANATVGEMVSVLRLVFGEYVEPVVI